MDIEADKARGGEAQLPPQQRSEVDATREPIGTEEGLARAIVERNAAQGEAVGPCDVDLVDANRRPQHGRQHAPGLSC